MKRGLLAAVVLMIAFAVGVFAAPSDAHRAGDPPTITAETTATIPVDPGAPVLLKPVTLHSGCRLGVLPDRRCSPGAYASNLTKDVICSPNFHTGDVRTVTDATKHQIEQEYGLAPKGYGSSLEIDHIVSLELGGSNDPANLYPEELRYPKHRPGFRIKDKLETKAATAVCAGTITLSYAQRRIAYNWKLLYKQLYDVVPTGP